MTPEERARNIVQEWFGFDLDDDLEHNDDLAEIIATAIREAVAEKDAEIERLRAAIREAIAAEREEYAKVAEAEMIERPHPDDNLARFYNEACVDIATAIRSRSKEREDG